MMKKIAFFLGIVFFVGMGALFASAQNEQPPPFPTISETATESITATPTQTTIILTVTPTPIRAQEVTDNADTGPEIYILIGLSVLGGLGIYFIKKYFDIRKYSL